MNPHERWLSSIWYFCDTGNVIVCILTCFSSLTSVELEVRTPSWNEMRYMRKVMFHSMPTYLVVYFQTCLNANDGRVGECEKLGVHALFFRYGTLLSSIQSSENRVEWNKLISADKCHEIPATNNLIFYSLILDNAHSEI